MGDVIYINFRSREGRLQDRRAAEPVFAFRPSAPRSTTAELIRSLINQPPRRGQPPEVGMRIWIPPALGAPGEWTTISRVTKSPLEDDLYYIMTLSHPKSAFSWEWLLSVQPSSSTTR